MVAARELLRGEVLYRDVWFDKPPLYAWFYTLCGGWAGWPLRLLGSLWLVCCAGSVYLLGRTFWGAREGLVAAAFTFLYLTFWIPSAVMAIAPDLLMFVPHVLAVAFAARGQSVAAGVMSGVALACNSKGLIVVAAAALWAPSAIGVIAGCIAVQAAMLLAIPARDYWNQVWSWGFRYSSAALVEDPLSEGLRRTGGWVWFHVTVVVGTVFCFWRERSWRLGVWLMLALAGVAAGTRFFPRYYFILLPVFAVAGARGILLVGDHRVRAALLLLLAIPLIRFGPRYVTVAAQGPDGWSDAALMQDSRAVSEMLPPGCDLLVWGYRPDIYIFSGCRVASRFLDSQPLTGVIADRHLVSSTVTFPEIGVANRASLVTTSPEFIVDGLGPANPSLSITEYMDLRSWLSAYRVVGQTNLSIVYKLRSAPDRPPLLHER